MKKLINILGAALLITSLTSCDSLLDMSPEDTMSPETYFSSTRELKLWTDGFYSQLEGADDVIGINADDNIDTELGATLLGQRSAADENGWNWTQLRSINYYLQHSDRCKDEVGRKENDGVAYFMRAYFYYVKVRRYGDVPWYDQVLNSDQDELLAKARDDREVIMDHVMEDLDKAINMLPSTKSVYYVTKWTALALKTRAALYEGTYRKYRNMPNAEKYLNQVVDAGENFIKNSGYKLYTTGDTPYRSLFNSLDACSDEVILARRYSSDANVMHGVPFAIKNSRQGFTKRFMNHYLMADGSRYTDKQGWETDDFVAETSNRDPRMAQTVLCPGYIQKGATKVTANNLNALTGYQPIKYIAESKYDGANKAFTDWSLFRTAEVYLNYAEAKAELGELTDADWAATIGALRSRAGITGGTPQTGTLTTRPSSAEPYIASYYPTISDPSLLEIRRERGIELCLEGLRLNDLKRWNCCDLWVNDPWEGIFIPSLNQPLDVNGDGNYDAYFYDTDKIADEKYAAIGVYVGTNKSNVLNVKPVQGGYLMEYNYAGRSWPARQYLYPIPEVVIQFNTNLSQNPGW